MKIYLKKMVSLFLALCMILTMLPASALATGTDPDAPRPVELPKTLVAVTAKASNTISLAGTDALCDVTLTSANLFPVSEDSAHMYIELSGLMASTWYSYALSYAEKLLIKLFIS